VDSHSYFFIILFFILNSILLLFFISEKCVLFVALEFLGSRELDIHIGLGRILFLIIEGHHKDCLLR
jgi:hypothetical protein